MITLCTRSAAVGYLSPFAPRKFRRHEHFLSRSERRHSLKAWEIRTEKTLENKAASGFGHAPDPDRSLLLLLETFMASRFPTTRWSRIIRARDLNNPGQGVRSRSFAAITGFRFMRLSDAMVCDMRRRKTLFRASSRTCLSAVIWRAWTRLRGGSGPSCERPASTIWPTGATTIGR